MHRGFWSPLKVLGPWQKKPGVEPERLLNRARKPLNRAKNLELVQKTLNRAKQPESRQKSMNQARTTLKRAKHPESREKSLNWARKIHGSNPWIDLKKNPETHPTPGIRPKITESGQKNHETGYQWPVIRSISPELGQKTPESVQKTLELGLERLGYGRTLK